MLIILLTIVPFGLCSVETENVAIVKRLDATEALVRTLLTEVEHLKSQDKLQRTQIAYLENQLRNQQQRSSQVERLMRRLLAHCRPKNTVSTEPIFVPKQESPSTGNPIHRILRANQQRIRIVENEMTIAFFAKMDTHLEHAGVHQTFVFETVVTNIGNGYHSHLGSFIAPVSGTYVFSTTLVSFYHVSAHAQFVLNGSVVTTMIVRGVEAGYDTTSQTIVLHLQKGDDLCIQNVELDKSFYGGSHSTFSGFLLHEDFSSSSVVGK